ncbi:MAG: DNA polymerase III subunit delta [Patescibacteria group bacterium]
MLIFLYGEDTFRSCQKLKELKNKFIHDIDHREENISVINGGTASEKEIIQAINTSSLLVKKRLIIIEEIFSNKTITIFEQLLNYLKNRSKIKDDNIIIFQDSRVKVKKTKIKEGFFIIDSTGRDKVLTKHPLALFKFLLKQPYSQQFSCLNNTETASWIKHEITKRGGIINLPVAHLLASLIGNNLWQISNEIDKLINYQLAIQLKSNESSQIIISEENVKKLVRGNFDENIFALTDAISSKNKTLAIKLLEEQIEAGLTSSYLLNMFIRQFRILLQIKQALEVGDSSRKIASELKIHPFVVQKGISQARYFSLPVLKNTVSQLIKIDYKIKAGKTDAITALNILIAKF